MDQLRLNCEFNPHRFVLVLRLAKRYTKVVRVKGILSYVESVGHRTVSRRHDKNSGIVMRSQRFPQTRFAHHGSSTDVTFPEVTYPTALMFYEKVRLKQYMGVGQKKKKKKKNAIGKC